MLVLEKDEEEREKVLDCVVLAHNGGESHDDGSEGCFYVLVRVAYQLLTKRKLLILTFSKKRKSTFYDLSRVRVMKVTFTAGSTLGIITCSWISAGRLVQKSEADNV